MGKTSLTWIVQNLYYILLLTVTVLMIVILTKYHDFEQYQNNLISDLILWVLLEDQEICNFLGSLLHC